MIELFLASHAQQVHDAVLERLANERSVERLAQRDASLWYPAPDTQARIRQRLGWLDLPSVAEVESALAALRTAIRERAAEQVIYVVPGVLGRAVRLWLACAARQQQAPSVLVLDTPDPAAVQHALKLHRQAHTLVVHAGVFDTPQAQVLAAALSPDLVLSLPPTVGDRFSALSVPALAPAALCGLDLRTMLDRARQVQAALSISQADTQVLQLGAALGALAQAGHDLLHLVASRELDPLARWLEALVAGALSKHWRGFVPVVGQVPTPRHARKSLLIDLGFADQHGTATHQLVKEAQLSNLPVVRVTLRDAADAAAQVMLWQLAIAITAMVIGLNPFDNPDADVINARIRQCMAAALASSTASVNDLHARLRNARFVAIAAYLAPAYHADLEALQATLATTYDVPVMLVYPLRDAAFSLQLLHAGRQGGVVLALTVEGMLPERDDSVAQLTALQRAQLAVEMETWQHMQRNYVHIVLSADVRASFAQMRAQLEAD
jgi:hypothetical protein